MHINKVCSNPWKLTPPSLHEQVQSMLNNLADFEAPIATCRTHRTPMIMKPPRLALGAIPIGAPFSSVPPTTLEQVKKTIDGLKRMVEQGKEKFHIWQSKLEQARGCVVKEEEEEEEAKLDENCNDSCAWSKEVGKAGKI